MKSDMIKLCSRLVKLIKPLVILSLLPVMVILFTANAHATVPEKGTILSSYKLVDIEMYYDSEVFLSDDGYAVLSYSGKRDSASIIDVFTGKLTSEIKFNEGHFHSYDDSLKMIFATFNENLIAYSINGERLWTYTNPAGLKRKTISFQESTGSLGVFFRDRLILLDPLNGAPLKTVYLPQQEHNFPWQGSFFNESISPNFSIHNDQDASFFMIGSKLQNSTKISYILPPEHLLNNFPNRSIFDFSGLTLDKKFSVWSFDDRINDKWVPTTVVYTWPQAVFVSKLPITLITGEKGSLHNPFLKDGTILSATYNSKKIHFENYDLQGNLLWKSPLLNPEESRVDAIEVSPSGEYAAVITRYTPSLAWPKATFFKIK